MTNETLAPIEELLRIPAPCPAPQALACDGTDLWVGSVETNRIYGVRGNTGAIFEESPAPGEPIGMVVTGDALRVVTSEGDDDNRFIRRYVFGHGFKSEALPCPDDTGSFLAYDGDNLFLSQRHQKRILELDGAGTVKRTIAVPREITGMVIVGGRFFLMTVESKTSEESRIFRIDARKDEPEIIEIANVPFNGRSLAWDGSKFWTNCRTENTIVAFNSIGV
ncbi:MAG: hypothetical protein NVS2B17_26600 [Candidatus Velthaea sp.]